MDNLVEKNNEYILDIISVGYEGEGIAKIDGYPIFIEGAILGERVKVLIVKVKKNYAYGKLLEVIESSAERVEPKCKVYKRCGGCTVQHMSYKKQLDYKFERVKDCISKIGGLDRSLVKYPIAMDIPERYRNKVQLPVGMVKGELNIGFYAPRSHNIINLDTCLIQDKVADKVAELTRKWMTKYNIPAASIDGVFNKNGLIRHIMIRKGFITNEVMVVLVATKEKIEKQLSKTGGTPFYIDEIKFHNMPDSLFIPISELNQIRRDVLAQAQDLLLNHYTPTKKSVKATRKKLNKFYEDYESFNNNGKKKNPKISLFIDNLDQLKSISGFDLKRVYFDGNCLYNNPEDYYENIPKLLEEASLMTPDAELVWVLSSFINEKEAVKCNEIVKELESKGIIISVMGDFPGMGEIFDCPIYGNHNLNVWNSFTVKNLKEAGFDGLILSSELSGNEIKHLISKNNTSDIDLEMIVNGNLEVIVSKDDFSNLNDGKDFIIHNNADYAILEDKKRKKFKYKVLFDYNKQSHIINKDCLCLIEEMNEIKQLGIDSIILDCRYSNEKYTTNILSIYNDSLKDRDDEELSKYKYQIMDFSQSYINKGNYIEGRLHEDKHENS